MFKINFENRGDIIELLYLIKEDLQDKPHGICNRYLSIVFDLIEKVIPKSKYYDADVKELIDDIVEVIFGDYAQKRQVNTEITFADNLIEKLARVDEKSHELNSMINSTQ